MAEQNADFQEKVLSLSWGLRMIFKIKGMTKQNLDASKPFANCAWKSMPSKAIMKTGLASDTVRP